VAQHGGDRLRGLHLAQGGVALPAEDREDRGAAGEVVDRRRAQDHLSAGEPAAAAVARRGEAAELGSCGVDRRLGVLGGPAGADGGRGRQLEPVHRGVVGLDRLVDVDLDPTQRHVGGGEPALDRGDVAGTGDHGGLGAGDLTGRRVDGLGVGRAGAERGREQGGGQPGESGQARSAAGRQAAAPRFGPLRPHWSLLDRRASLTTGLSKTVGDADQGL
jgi:hypothetical protein